MARVVAELFADVAVTRSTAAADLPLDVRVDGGAGEPALLLDVVVDGTAGAAAQPRDGEEQCVGFEVYVDGSLVPMQTPTGAVSVSRSLDDVLQTWGFGAVLDTPTGPFGSPFPCAGPPLKKKRIDLYGVYRTSTGVHRVPLITWGIADSSPRSETTTQPPLEQHSGVDRGGRFDRKLINLVFPLGHGLPRDRVVQRSMEEAGETRFALEPERAMRKEVQFVDSAPLPQLQEIVDVENRRLLWSRNADLVNPRVGKPRPDEPVVWTFDGRDLIDLTVEPQSDVLTKVTINGTEQLAASACGLLTVPTRFETKAQEAPPQAGYLQDTGGSFTPQSPQGAPPEPIVVALEVREVTTRCGIVVYERTRRYALLLPQVPRYTWNASTNQWDPLGCYTDENVLQQGPGFPFRVGRWALESVDEAWHYYHQARFVRENSVTEPGYYLGLAFPFDDGYSLGDRSTGPIIGPGANHKLGVLRRSWGLKAPRAAVKQRDPNTHPLDVWETDVEFAGGLEVLGSKEAIDPSPVLPAWLPSIDRYPSLLSLGNGEALTLLEETAELFQGDEKHYLRKKEIHKATWDRRPGAAYLYGDGFESADAVETFRYVGTTYESYEAVGDESHNVIRTGVDRDGSTVPATSDLGVPSYLPAIDMLPITLPNDAVYASTTERDALAESAFRDQTAPFSVEVSADGLLDGHEENPYVGELVWAEDGEEAEAAGQAMIDEAAAMPVRGTLAYANYFLNEGDVVRIVREPLGLDHLVRIKKVSWSGDGWSAIHTPFEARLYAW